MASSYLNVLGKRKIRHLSPMVIKKQLLCLTSSFVWSLIRIKFSTKKSIVWMKSPKQNDKSPLHMI